MRRLIRAVTAAAGMAVGTAAWATVTVTPLVLAGDFYGGTTVLPGFSSVSRLEVNSSGQWLIFSTLAGSIDVLMTGQGTTLPATIVAMDGDPVASGGNLRFFGRLSINSAGNSGFYATYENAGAADSGIHYNTATQVMVEQSVASAPQFTPGTLYIGFFGGILNDDGQMLVMASVDDSAIASSVDRALVLVTNPGGAPTQSVLMKEGDEVVAGRFLSDFQTNPHTWSFAAGGKALVSPDMDGDSASDTGLLYYDGSVWSFVAREGEACAAAPGRNWGNFGSTNASDVNNGGQWAVRGTLDGASEDNSIIVRNGTDVIAREGSPVDALPAFNFTGFGSGAVKIDDSGNVFYYGVWNDTDTTRNAGLFRNGELLVQKGVTTDASGNLVTDVAGVQDNFSISRNGRYVVFEGDVTDLSSFVRRGTILVDLGAGCPADFNGSGAVSVQDIFDFLAAYFANDPDADFNHSGGVSVQDIFDYLAAYFAGCP